MTNKDGKQRKKAHNLTFAQQVELGNWIEKNKEKISNEKWTYQDVADKTTRELRFMVTKGNAMGACRGMGVEMMSKGSPGTLRNVVDSDRIRYLAAILVDVMTSLGSDVPPALLEIVDGVKIVHNEAELRRRLDGDA